MLHVVGVGLRETEPDVNLTTTQPFRLIFLVRLFQVKKEEEQARLLHSNYGSNSQGSALSSSTTSSLSPPPPTAAGSPAAGVAAAAGGGGGGEASRGSPGPALMPQVGCVHVLGLRLIFLWFCCSFAPFVTDIVFVVAFPPY